MKKNIFILSLFLGLVTIANVKYSLIGAKKISIKDEGNSAPYDAEVEYLESTGKQYIDTGFTFSLGYSFSLLIMPIANDTIHYYGSNGDTGEVLCSHSGVFYWGGTRAATGINRIGEKVEIDGSFKDNGSWLYVNGVLLIQNGGVPNNGKVYLFAWTDIRNNIIRYCRERLYRHEIKFNGEVVQSLIPVRIRDEGCLYDLVSGNIYHSIGTEPFILGPDL